MKLRAWLLRSLSGPCGAATKNTLRGLARSHGYADEFEETFKALIAAGAIVMVGDRRGATYAIPKRRK